MVMIEGAKRVNIMHQHLWLLPEKAVYWKKKKLLLLADLHIGKSEHFRKHGIPVPRKVNRTNLELLDSLIEKLNPDQIIILGDLFHSNENREWEFFEIWRKKHKNLEFNLVLGNHDILPGELYHASYINLFKKLKISPFTMVHDMEKLTQNGEDTGYLLSGHIHPAVKLKGKGRQVMKLPCFWFGDGRGILPAFGQFTGTHVVHPKRRDRVYVPVEGGIIRLNK